MKIYSLVVGVILIFSSCSSKSYVKFVDNKIQRYIEISDVKKRVREDGLTEIQINGLNETDDYMLFKYRVVWQDKDGFEIKSISSNWTEFPTHKKAQFRISVISPNPKATDYQIYINK